MDLGWPKTNPTQPHATLPCVVVVDWYLVVVRAPEVSYKEDIMKFAKNNIESSDPPTRARMTRAESGQEK